MENYGKYGNMEFHILKIWKIWKKYGNLFLTGKVKAIRLTVSASSVVYPQGATKNPVSTQR